MNRYRALVFAGTDDLDTVQNETRELSATLPWLSSDYKWNGDRGVLESSTVIRDRERYNLYLHTDSLVDLGAWKRYELSSPTPHIHSVLLREI